MRAIHLTLVIFCQILLASLILYSSLVSAGSVQHQSYANQKDPVNKPSTSQVSTVGLQQPTRVGKNANQDASGKLASELPVVIPASEQVIPKLRLSSSISPEILKPSVVRGESAPAIKQPIAAAQATPSVSQQSATLPEAIVAPVVSSSVNPPAISAAKIPEVAHTLVQPELKLDAPAPLLASSLKSAVKSVSVVPAGQPIVVGKPVVKGGQGPLHMLAETLCNYSPERPFADEALIQLYAQRAAVRKSLFDFMSLKFTNLEKISSRLNAGIAVMPPKPVSDPSQSNVAPSHGWPIVGKCTAHDLRLMAEAAWCECADDLNCDSPSKPKSAVVQQAPKQVLATKVEQQTGQAVNVLTDADFASASSRHQRSVEQDSPVVSLPKPHVHHLHEQQIQQHQAQVAASAQKAAPAPVVEQSSSKNDQPEHTYYLAGLNLTEHQLSVIQAQAGLTQECKRNSLRFTKALFNHLAEDQNEVSNSWPKLYSQLVDDECARKRMIDVVTALSSFRTESTSIRRDNLEFAFAMDDLRSKVLGTEVNTPLQFDKQIIEVEQFLQQSVKLMLATIDPERAKLTSMRYRSLVPGLLSSDDQCVQLHQLLLAKSHPTECNPNQYGQLTDVLRMSAHSLSLWSIENEIAKLSFKYPEYSASALPSETVNECISNLVSS